MKKKSMLLAVMFLVVSTTVVSARGSLEERQVKMDEKNALVQERQKQVQERVETRDIVPETRTQEVQEQRSILAGSHAERLENRFRLYSLRFEKIIEKIRTRMAKMQDRGIDVSAAESSLTMAEEAISQAEMLAKEAVAAVLAVGQTENAQDVRSSIAEAKKAIEAARLAYKAVGEILKDTLVLLKDATVAANTAAE